MKVFIFEDVENLTGNYHSDGGLVVIAENEIEARELIATEKMIKKGRRGYVLITIKED